MLVQEEAKETPLSSFFGGGKVVSFSTSAVVSSSAFVASSCLPAVLLAIVGIDIKANDKKSNWQFQGNNWR